MCFSIICDCRIQHTHNPVLKRHILIILLLGWVPAPYLTVSTQETHEHRVTFQKLQPQSIPPSSDGIIHSRPPKPKAVHGQIAKLITNRRSGGFRNHGSRIGRRIHPTRTSSKPARKMGPSACRGALTLAARVPIEALVVVEFT